MMALDTTALNSADIGVGTAVQAAVEGRANIFEMTQAAEEAVLRPKDAGPWSHSLRAALAARIANLNDEAELAARYAADAGDFAALVQPTEDGAAQGLAEVVGFMDKVAADTRRVAGNDILALQSAGVADADIVRLAELNAFLAYQIRVIAGLRLMKGMSA
ncbi:hypothetical protein KUV64_24525 [Mameliella alba]|nr:MULTISPECIES: hypothetical protein [Mameliella]MBY6122305.1 hypothetical protein [Mameliella alba]MDD9732897.1 hypothetical protein [Mameliella sp. AT18]OWV39687.1 hypothetical protein CDZ95_24675 [Mameliella alba]OWV42095.1 hypothetical protein CDZ96_23785 [Mameliella alba]OWV53752.1 hypothetical protein CDZ97_24830 [Mameliella alba]